MRTLGMRALGVWALGIVLALGAGGCDSDPAPGPRTWRLSHITSPRSTWHRGAEEFARLVNQELPEFQVEVYPFGQLANGDQKTELQMARSGAIDVMLVSTIVLAQYADPRFDVVNLPFLFPDHATARAVIAGGPFSDALTGLLGEDMLVPLAWGANGFRQLTTKGVAVHAPSDLEGLKVRVAGSRLFQDIFLGFGARGINMSFGELFTSLEQGVVDAQENPLSIIESARMSEVQDHVILWNYVYDPIAMVVSVPVWDSLSSGEKSVVLAAAREAMEFQARLVEREDEDLPPVLEEQGMTVVRLTPEEIEAFREVVLPVHQRYRPRVGPQLYDLLNDSIAAHAPPRAAAVERAEPPVETEAEPAAPPAEPTQDASEELATDEAEPGPAPVRVVDE